MRRSVFWLQRGWSTCGLTLEKKPYSRGLDFIHAVDGWPGQKRMATIDLIDLKPYFHGTTSRIGAPFWLGMARPYTPTASRVSGCMASSMRRPST